MSCEHVWEHVECEHCGYESEVCTQCQVSYEDLAPKVAPFPRDTEAMGWTISYHVLLDISRASERNREGRPSMEEVEAVLLAAAELGYCHITKEVTP